MIDSLADATTQELIIAEFFGKWTSAADPDAVLFEYCEKYPELAEQFRRLVDMEDQVARANPPAAPAPVQRLERGRKLGEFTITQLIAAGGMGEVYKAEQARLKRSVAVKVIRRNRVSSEAKRRFLREQETLAKLHQTHIVPIHTAGEIQDDDLQYFAMAYIDGAPLNRVVDVAYETSYSGLQTPSLGELAGTASAELAAIASTGAATTLEPAALGSKNPDARLKLPPAYFRSVAEVMAQAAEAIQHAHDVKIYHRDVKPSNLMVDRTGHCWIIDFGLAGLLCEPGATAPTVANSLMTNPNVGTLPYMAPEQHDGDAAASPDVWGLGTTLYELLTLRRAFDAPTREAIVAKVKSEEPKSARELVPAVPADLDAICRMAMRKDQRQRYATPGEFGADLRRWLGHEPTVARPARALRRAGLWARRNQGWAAAIGILLLAVAGAGAAVIQDSKRQSELAKADADKANAEAESNRIQLEAAEHTSTILQLQTRRQSVRRSAGWSNEALLGTKALANSAERRDYAAATLIGLDATKHWSTAKADALSVRFFPDGKRLIIGGLSNFDEGKETLGPGFIWSGNHVDEPKQISQNGSCLLAFASDGAPLQLLYPTKQRKSLLLWDVDKQKSIHEFSVPGEGQRLDAVAVSAAGVLVAASVSQLADPQKGTTTIWDAGTGKVIRQIDRSARAIAFSPDNRLIAISDPDGDTSVWPLPDGAMLFTLPAERNPINCLAFGHSPFRTKGKRPLPGDGQWLLAAGMKGGAVVIWDLDRRSILTRCHGAEFDVNAVAFSPDRSMLAVAARRYTTLFDVTTGKTLLNIEFGNVLTDLSFSPDARRLAISNFEPGNAKGILVCNLDNSRGLHSLRGLVGPISKVAIANDAKCTAALSHGWQVAIWHTDIGLRHVFDVPPGFTADNAALVVSGDGKRVAFSTGERAVLWDADSGREVDSWQLPLGLNDQLAFDLSGRLLSFRTETKDGKMGPLSNSNPAEHPRVWQLRELQPGGKVRVVKAITAHNWYHFGGFAALDGSYFVGEGFGGERPNLRRSIDAYSGDSGQRLWSIEQPPSIGGSGLTLDPLGKALSFVRPAHKTNESVVTLLEMPSGRFIQTAGNESLIGLGPEAKSWLTQTTTKSGIAGLSYFRRGEREPVVTLGLDQTKSSVYAHFNRSGSHVVWGNSDGTLTVCDINDVLRRLDAAGLR